MSDALAHSWSLGLLVIPFLSSIIFRAGSASSNSTYRLLHLPGWKPPRPGWLHLHIRCQKSIHVNRQHQHPLLESFSAWVDRENAYVYIRTYWGLA
ncbi:hypothetical protein GGR56DRAFT_645928 [Xylariaceae sp. FL0804]|nr:hypothetical protein GGR56DRAFT_645928 [Xylariaceae sp. FL0804]